MVLDLSPANVSPLSLRIFNLSIRKMNILPFEFTSKCNKINIFVRYQNVPTKKHKNSASRDRAECGDKAGTDIFVTVLGFGFCLFFFSRGGGISLQLWFKVSSDTYMYLFIHWYFMDPQINSNFSGYLRSHHSGTPLPFSSLQVCPPKVLDKLSIVFSCSLDLQSFQGLPREIKNICLYKILWGKQSVLWKLRKIMFLSSLLF